MTNEQQPVTVIQADRDAAARCRWFDGIKNNVLDQYHNGMFDNTPIVQTFARHRIATEQRDDGWRDIADAPKSWRLVPIEPTAAMVEAWTAASPDWIGFPPATGLSDDEANLAAARADWSAMLDAAPAPPKTLDLKGEGL